MNNKRWLPALISVILLPLLSCTPDAKKTLFHELPEAESGISFANTLHDNDSTFSFINEFGYMGAGVGIGDFNNDGLKDIVFTGNQVSSRLYLNEGGNRFTDITEKAGLITSDWCTGVSIADVNNDGYDDIYICVFGEDLRRRSKNRLYINQHNLSFREMAAEYGLADNGFSTQAVFTDYDRDGDLDMYLANYLLSPGNANTVHPRDLSGFSPANDKLFRNDGDSAGAGHPVFSDQTRAAGIRDDGYGLGVSVSDFNHDGWPDIYVANDFLSNDLLWQNNGDGSFTNVIATAMRHQSYSSMGSDAADLDNDGLTDLVTLDMLPEINERKKTSYSLMNFERFESERALDYEPEFTRNMLQLNRGVPADQVPRFSEIGRFAGVHATDWSWSVLLADFNNDGWKDMHVTNGIGRDFINADFLEFSAGINSGNQDQAARQKAIRARLASLDNVNLLNYLFINNGKHGFTDSSAWAGVDDPSMSNGAAWADLDNDGDLDLIVNNINRPAFIGINTSNSPGKQPAGHYLKVRLQGDSLNPRGFGTRLVCYQGASKQVVEQNPVRGYFSSVDQDLFFGLGVSGGADSILVVWPDGKEQLVSGPLTDTLITPDYRQANKVIHVSDPASADSPLFEDITGAHGLAYRHVESPVNDYAMQRLLPQKYSQLGPFISTADINNDGMQDLFIGGAFNFHGALFTQQPAGGFTMANLGKGSKFEEDQDCTFFDADGDGDPDLLITSGGMQYEAGSPYYRPRLYVNDGKGNFLPLVDAIPAAVSVMAGSVAAGDYDNDGDQDLFIGGRISTSYPQSPRSYILRNDKGVFTDVTAAVCPALLEPGMITAGVWTDYNGDGIIDLVIAGEWMPVRFFSGKGGRLTETTGHTGLNDMHGMWRSLVAVDLDNDGDTDFVAGNLGLNCEYGVSAATPMQLFAADYDGNGSIDPFPFYYIRDQSGKKNLYPAYGRGRMAEQVPALKKKFLLNREYASAGYAQVFSGYKGKIDSFTCNETRSCYLENTGGGKFVKRPLPPEAQYSPVNAIVCADIDSDGVADILLAGNEYQAEVMTGAYDASYGCFLKGYKEGERFRSVAPDVSGWMITGDVKDMVLLPQQDGSRLLVAGVNNDVMKVFRIRPSVTDNKKPGDITRRR